MSGKNQEVKLKLKCVQDEKVFDDASTLIINVCTEILKEFAAEDTLAKIFHGGTQTLSGSELFSLIELINKLNCCVCDLYSTRTPQGAMIKKALMEKLFAGIEADISDQNGVVH